MLKYRWWLMKNKLNLRKFLILFIFFSMLVICIKKAITTNIITESNEADIKSYNVIDTIESDQEVINSVFEEGMNTDDYKSLFDRISTNVTSEGTYQLINYDFENRLTYKKIEEYIHEMSKSSIVNTYIIGKTLDNRSIYNVEIGKGSKVLLLDAGIHAAESANTHILMKFLIDILNDYESNSEIVVNMLNNVKIASIPCINPDGYEAYSFGIENINNKELWLYQNKSNVDFKRFKYNANGIDINRNFPTQNAGLYYLEEKLHKSVAFSKTTAKGKYYGGNTLGSEPETKAVMYQDLTHYKNAYAYINLHSQGRVIYSGKPNLSDEYNRLTIDLCNRIGNITGYKVHGLSREEIGQGNDGTASDFMAELANGFIFSSKTGRLSSSSYKNNSSAFIYPVPAIVVETMDDNYKDAKKFKDEYYNHGIKEMLYDLLKYGTELN